jgi:hypothetical protein
MDRGYSSFLIQTFHVSVMKHKGIDGLSRRPLADDDPIEEEDDHEDWIDHVYSFGVALLNDRTHHIVSSSTDIIHHVHKSSYIMQDVCAPTHHVFLEVAQEDDPTPIIPRSATAQNLDMSLIRTCEFLILRKRPTDLSDHDFAVFVNNVAQFFVQEGNLWRREPHGRHQLVVQLHKCYCILKEVHDDLGHKGVYTTHVHLLLCFWWLHIVEDIKWYIKMCHKCQTQQMHKLHIPPTVPMPGGLFHKAHIDTMKMPRVDSSISCSQILM